MKNILSTGRGMIAMTLAVSLAISGGTAAEASTPLPVAVRPPGSPVEDDGSTSGPSGDREAIADVAREYEAGDAVAAAALVEAASAESAVPLDTVLSTTGAAVPAVSLTNDGSVLLSSGDGVQVGVGIAGEAGAAGEPAIVAGVAVQTSVLPDTDLVTRATLDGAQILAVLADEDAGDRVSFAFDLPATAELLPQADGSIRVTDEVEVQRVRAGEEERLDREVASVVGDLESLNDLTPAQVEALEAIAPAATNSVMETHTIATIATPWAVDANGAELPTRYELSGNALTQVVDTRNAEYPITIDPHWSWWVWTAATCAANVATFVFGAAKLAYAVTKINSLVRKSSTVARIVQKIGGAKALLASIHKAARGFIEGRVGKYLSSTQRLALSSFVSVGLSMLGDLLGIGSCMSLLRAAL
ncbi:hypothetical protein ACFUTX_10265 [Microbacterium sp. NPDC057407]|uniref:hypothetical protein n=1 Tax=Microbacterium sp. NPDC057407 TaxID=3346120 RepID=UPI00366DDC5A